MSKRFQNLNSASSNPQRAVPCVEPNVMSQHRDLDATKRDRFELLSAYLDGEVSPEERRLVTVWLEHDPETQCLYRRLLHLRRGFQGLQAHPWQSPTNDAVAEQVIRKINHRFRLTCMAGMTAAAVAVIGVFSGALNPIERIDFGYTAASSDDDGLEIALDQPPIMIPKPAMAPNPATMDSVLPNQGTQQPSLAETSL